MACCQQYTFTALFLSKWIITKIYVTNHLTTTAWDQSALETTNFKVERERDCQSCKNAFIIFNTQQETTLNSHALPLHCSDQTHTSHVTILIRIILTSM